jgi:uncharacterized short protein YbdD (DUF466 family)
MGARLNKLLRGQSAALRRGSTPCLPLMVCLRRSPRRALHLDLLPTFLRLLKVNGRNVWRAIRQLSGDDGYERYLAHCAADHPEQPVLSRRAWFAHQQQQKWTGIKRCC